jgi:hypothetical protein
MSMICRILGLSQSQIAALRASPSLASDLTTATQQSRFDEVVKQMPPEQRKQFDANPALKEMLARGAQARERTAALGPVEQALSLEKSWHILHYLLTGHVGPAGAPGDLLLTGEDVGQDVGYGPARLHTPAETRAFSQFLETQDPARLMTRVNPASMRQLGVYAIPMGRGSDTEYEGELREEVGRYFPLLRDYVRDMSNKGNGLLIWVS